MKNKIIYPILFSFIALAGCKEVYEPDIESEKTAVVIQGMMTNIEGQLAVRITRAVPYDSTDSYIQVRNASVMVYDNLWNMIKLENDGFGVYRNPEAKSIPGRSYFLKVSTPEGDTYESTPQSLPERFTQDTIYAANVARESYVISSSGDYFKSTIKGIETYADISGAGTVFPKCRYDVLVTILYVFIPPGQIMPPTIYCWKSFNPNGVLNVTSSKFEKTIGFAPKHNLGFFRSNIINYDDREGVALAGWLIQVNKFSLNNETHQFYLNVKNQLEASGKLFDPVPAQIRGNIKCTNNPQKIALGFFEVSHAEKLYFRYNVSREPITLTQKDGFPGFTNEGEVANFAPAFWFK